MHTAEGGVIGQFGELSFCEFSDPGGISAISRWLSAATPPEPVRTVIFDPDRGRSNESKANAATPVGVDRESKHDPEVRCATSG